MQNDEEENLLDPLNNIIYKILLSPLLVFFLTIAHQEKKGKRKFTTLLNFVKVIRSPYCITCCLFRCYRRKLNRDKGHSAPLGGYSICISYTPNLENYFLQWVDLSKLLLQLFKAQVGVKFIFKRTKQPGIFLSSISIRFQFTGRITQLLIV